VEKTPIREIKPVVVPAQFFVWGPLVAGFISIFPGFFTFVISNMISMMIGMFSGNPFERLSHGPVVVYGVVVFLLSFVACMALLWVKVFKEPGRTTYAISSSLISSTKRGSACLLC